MAFDFLHRNAKGCIALRAASDEFTRMNYGGVIPVETITDGWKRTVTEFAAKIHRYMSAEGKPLGALFGPEVRN